MRFITPARSHALIATIVLSFLSLLNAPSKGAPAGSQAEQVLAQSSEQDQFTFLVFYRAEDAATRAMADAVEQGVAAKGNGAALAFVQITNPADKRLVDRLSVARAPMPLCLTIAANGAVTGVFRKTPSADDLAKALVTPTMTRCMKAMQDGKIVLISVQNSRRTPIPAAVAEFQADPEFKDRIASVSLPMQDPAEARFLAELEIDATNSAGIATVMLAPPGVLVGKFPANATMGDLAAELHEAGQCCDDENCKHRKQAASGKHATTQKPANTRRN